MNDGLGLLSARHGARSRSPIKVLVASDAVHAIAASVLLNHELAIRAALAVLLLHELQGVLFKIAHLVVDVLGRVLGTRDVLVPWNQTLSTRSHGALVARHLGETGGSDVWQADGGAVGRDAFHGLGGCVFHPHVEHFHVELLEGLAAGHELHDVVVVPGLFAAGLEAACAYLAGSESVKTSGHGVADAGFAYWVNILPAWVAAKVGDAVEWNVYNYRESSTLRWNPAHELVDGLLLNADAAAVMCGRWSTCPRR